MAYDSAEDRRLAKLALEGGELPAEQEEPTVGSPDARKFMINFAIPGEGGAGSGSGEEGQPVVEPTPRSTFTEGWTGMGGGLTSPPSGPGLLSGAGRGLEMPSTEPLPPPGAAVGAPVVRRPAGPLPSTGAEGEPGAADMGVAHGGAGGSAAAKETKGGLELGTGPFGGGVVVKPTLDWREEEEARKAAQAALAAKGQALTSGAAAQDRALADAKYYQEKNAEREQIVQDRMAESNRLQNARMQYLRDDITKNPIDADKYIHDMPVWAKAVMLLGAAAGGFLQGFKGVSGNATMEAFQSAINRNIEAQKIAQEGKYKNIDMENNLFAQNMGIYKDQIAAIHGATADHWMLARSEAENIKAHMAAEADKSGIDAEIDKMGMEEAKARREAGLRFNVITQESVAAKQQAEQAVKTKALMSEADRLSQGLSDIVAGRNPRVPLAAPAAGKAAAPAAAAPAAVKSRVATPADGEPVSVGGNTVVFVPKGPDGDAFKKRLEAARTGHSTETLEQIMTGTGFYLGQRTGPSSPPVITNQVARGEATYAPAVSGKGSKPPTGRQISAEVQNQLADPANPQVPGTLSGLRSVDFSALDVPHARRLAQSLYHQAELLGVGPEIKSLIPEDPHTLGSQMHWDEKVDEAAKLINAARADRWKAKESLSAAGVTGGFEPSEVQ